MGVPRQATRNYHGLKTCTQILIPPTPQVSSHVDHTHTHIGYLGTQKRFFKPNPINTSVEPFTRPPTLPPPPRTHIELLHVGQDGLHIRQGTGPLGGGEEASRRAAPPLTHIGPPRRLSKKRTKRKIRNLHYPVKWLDATSQGRYEGGGTARKNE